MRMNSCLNTGNVTEVRSSGISGGLAAKKMIIAVAATAIRASRASRARLEIPAVVCLVTLA